MVLTYLPHATCPSPPTGLSPSPVAPSSSVRLPGHAARPHCRLARAGRPTPSPLPGGSPLGDDGLGSSRFARHYSGNPSLLLGVLRCFTSPGPHPPSRPRPKPSTSQEGDVAHHHARLPHSDTPGSPLARSSPGRFAARPRPSSALAAEASTVRPSPQSSPSGSAQEHRHSRMDPGKDASHSARLVKCASATQRTSTTEV